MLHLKTQVHVGGWLQWDRTEEVEEDGQVDGTVVLVDAVLVLEPT